MVKKTIIYADYGEIEKLAEKAFGLKDYSFAEVEECGNDTSHEFNVGPVKGIELEFDQDKIESIKSGKRVPRYCTGLLMNILYEAGHLEEGEYVVRVSW